MSYLPRMSKTYKEPLQAPKEEESSMCFGVQPASSLVDEKTYNPQTILKHYNYSPHAPPVLPGPSLAVEAEEDELYKQLSQQRRSTLSSDPERTSQSTVTTTSERLSELNAIEDENEKEENEFENLKNLKGNLKIRSVESKGESEKNKSTLHKKKSSHGLTKKKKSLSKFDIRRCFVEADVNPMKEILNKSKYPTMSYDLDYLVPGRKSPPIFPKNSYLDHKNESKSKELLNRSVQCTIFGRADKIYVIPSVVNSLLRALAFLLHELNREEATNCSWGEKKRLMTQIQLILGDLSNESAESEFGFDTNYSDSKRLEKILGDLRKYIKGVYGDKGEYLCEIDNMKKVFVELRKKELELAVLNDTISERDSLQMTEVEVKHTEYEHPEVTLQNKRLERDQLLAEIEFSSKELKKYRTALGEADWDVRMFQEQIASLRKTRMSKSKTEILGRKPSVLKFSSGSRGKESEFSSTKKKI